MKHKLLLLLFAVLYFLPGMKLSGSELHNVQSLTGNNPIEKYLGIFSTVSWLVIGLCVIIGLLILYILFDFFRGIRHVEGLSLKKWGYIIIGFFLTVPLLLGIYFFPGAVGTDWKWIFSHANSGFKTSLYGLFSFMAGANLLFILSLIFPFKDQSSFKNKYLKPLPMILSLSFLSGIGSAAVLFLISTSFFSPLALSYLIFYFALALFISMVTQKIVQTRMTVITNDIVYELRMRLIRKIFGTRYQQFEKIDSGRIYATLNNDTEAISTSASLVVGTVSNFVTAVAAFIYLSAISLTATLFTLLFALLLGGFYIIVGKRVRVLMEKMRDTQNVFMKLIEGLVHGFREISMHYNKKVEYEKDVEKSSSEYRETRISSAIKFVNVNIMSNFMMLILLAGICISFPRLFPEMSLPRLISFIMVLLYMIGPVTAIMGSFPTFIRIKVSWDRIQKFIAEIPAIEGILDYKELKSLSHKGQTVESIEVDGVFFHYPGEEGKEGFSVGPISFNVKKGEILFLVGGNGSGKTTLAKMITGLYMAKKGGIKINGKEIGGDDYLGEYFSVVFGDFHLFEKLYNVNKDIKREDTEKYLKALDLKGKVDIKDGSFSTINVSGGQRKRLALLQCYLEDCPIYLFDEVAADQDPEFRKFFYHQLLREMKERGKIVIAITHDDHYFDIADKIIKLDMGQIDETFTKMK